MFESALCAGLTASGADAYLLHVTTTPSVSYVARADDFDCGIMISASHNPYHDNGIKLLNGEGEKMDDTVLDGIEAYLDSSEELPYATLDAIGRTVDYAAGRNRYIGYLISLATRSYKGKKVGLDCANGSTWMMAKSVFDALGADTFVINNHPDGLNIGMRHISLSTCGVVPGIDALAEEDLQLTLSVSLHAPDSETRSRIMPVNRAWDVEELFAACHRYFRRTGRRISFEYAMIDGVNDHDWQADLIAKRIAGMPGHVNLIPLNDVVESPFKPSRRVAAFQKRLESHGITATVRRSLGGDIDASCGQLRRRAMEERKGGDPA